MESSARIFRSPNLTRHLRTSSAVVFLQQQPSTISIPNKHHPPFLISPLTSAHNRTTSSPISFCGGSIRASSHSIFSRRVSGGQFGGLLYNSLTSASFHSSNDGSVTPDVDDTNKFSDDSYLSTHGEDTSPAAGDKGPLVTAVLMGWLGAEPKHLRRYAELYNSRGIHSVNFVISAKEVVSIDMGKKLEGRIESFCREIESWLNDSGKDGRQRFLIFHTFSNTGWLAYGSILEKFQGKKNLLEKIKGCVVDSGADPEINPKVWAAGFGTAVLKKRSSSVYTLNNETTSKIETDTGISTTKTQNKETTTTTTPFVEYMLLALLEKIFNVLLHRIPYLNGRLKKIIDILTNKQPYCPQLYLYSTSDKVIPYRSVESFIEDQKRKGGREVTSFNFVTSPHVDHYRNFPEIYSSKLNNFLEMSLSKTS